MIVKMNNGSCEINIVKNVVNTLAFSNTIEKDEFLFNLYSVFKVKHKRKLWNNHVVITDDEFDDIESKSYEVFALQPHFNNLDEDKDFQKLFSKYIATLDCCSGQILNEIKIVQENLFHLLDTLSNEISFIKLISEDKSIPLSQLLKSVNINCVKKDCEEFNTSEAKIKYIELMKLTSVENKDNLYIILYPECGVGLSEQKKMLQEINKINGTVIVITNSATFLSNESNIENSMIIFDNYCKLSIEYCINEMKKINRFYSIQSLIVDLLYSIEYKNEERSKLISNILFG